MAKRCDALTETRVLRMMQQLSASRATHWVGVREVALRMDLQRSVVDAVVRRAVDQGRMLSVGEPPDRVSFSDADLTDFRALF